MVLVILACAAPELAPSLDLRNDEMLSEVPASATVLGGGNLAALWRSPTADWMSSEGFLARSDLDGVPMDDLGEARMGCGDGGCVVVVDGDFSSLQAENLGARVPGLRLETGDGETRLVPPAGKPMAVRLRGGRLRGGDLEAGSGFDPSVLGEEVPAGDAWMLIREPERMRAQAAARLRAEGTLAGADAATFLEQLPESGWRRVVSAAWSLDSENEALTVRLVAVDADAAKGFESLARVQLAAISLAPDLRVAGMALNAEVRRVDRVLEIEVHP